MRLLTVSLALATAGLLACGTTTPTAPAGPDPQASSLAAQKLCYVFQHAGEACRASEDLVEAGGRTLKVAATIAHQMDLPGGAARNVSYAISLKGEEPGLPIEVLAKGTDPTDALDRGAQEWAALAGTALVDAVRDTGKSEAVAATLKASQRAPADAEAPAALTVGGLRAYPGISDFRGAPSGGPVVDHAALLEALSSEVTRLDANASHALLVSMKHDGNRMVCEKGEIDGKQASGVCAAATAFAWPAPVSPYSVRQVYVFVPGGTPPEARPAPAPDTDAAPVQDAPQ